MNNNFCVIPWIHAATKTNGDARVCCLMSNHENGGLTGHNWSTADTHTIQNSDMHKRIRQDILSGNKPAECNTCWVKESRGGSSRRLFSNRVFKDYYTYENAIADTQDDGSIDVQPIYWDIRFGNLCNLKCVMCGPQSSSQWYKDWQKVYDTDEFSDSGRVIKFNDTDTLDKTYNWWKSPDFWKTLEQNLPYVKHLYLVGGEPTIIEQHYNFLEMLVEKGYAQDITLEYDTNITNMHVRAIDLWSKFKHLYLRVSIDDFGERNNYIRYPSKWESIDNNILRLQQAIPDLELEVSLTWQVLNCYTFRELYKWFEKDQISVRILSSPDHLDCAWLPKHTKQELINLYTEHSMPVHLINYLESHLDDYDEDMHKQFLYFCKKLDAVRGTSWKETFVDLHNSINT